MAFFLRNDKNPMKKFDKKLNIFENAFGKRNKKKTTTTEWADNKNYVAFDDEPIIILVSTRSDLALDQSQ